MKTEITSLRGDRAIIEAKQDKATITLLIDKDGGVSGLYSTLEGSLKGGLDEDDIERFKRGK